MSKIHYLVGDATDPQGKSDKIICHICNDLGGWGAGFVLALSKKWDEPEKLYRKWHAGTITELDFNCINQLSKFELGAVQLIKPDLHQDIYVANMIAQHDVKWYKDIPPIRYDRLRQCLNEVAKQAEILKATVHMPDLIGCGLAGGHKTTVIGIIEETLIAQDIEVYVYTLPE